jgi:hypothetical protein
MYTGFAFLLGALVGLAVGAERALAGSPRPRAAATTPRPRAVGT